MSTSCVAASLRYLVCNVNKISKSFVLPYHKVNVKTTLLNSCWQILSHVLANSQLQLNRTKQLLAELSQEPITVSLLSSLQLTKGLCQKIRHVFQMPKRGILALPVFCLYMLLEEHQLFPWHRLIMWSAHWKVWEVLVGSCSKTVVVCMKIKKTCLGATDFFPACQRLSFFHCKCLSWQKPLSTAVIHQTQ